MVLQNKNWYWHCHIMLLHCHRFYVKQTKPLEWAEWTLLKRSSPTGCPHHVQLLGWSGWCAEFIFMGQFCIRIKNNPILVSFQSTFFCTAETDVLDLVKALSQYDGLDNLSQSKQVLSNRLVWPLQAALSGGWSNRASTTLLFAPRAHTPAGWGGSLQSPAPGPAGGGLLWLIFSDSRFKKSCQLRFALCSFFFIFLNSVWWIHIFLWAPLRDFFPSLSTAVSQSSRDTPTHSVSAS